MKKLGLDFLVKKELGHERLKFNYNQLLKFILKMYRLDKIAVNSAIETCATIDGANFTSHVSHVTCGLKIVDIRAIDPKTNKLLLNFQSRDLSFVFESHLMKDTKEGYNHFKDFLIG